MKILAVTYGGGHVALIAPVVKELMRRGHDVTVLGLTTAGSYLKEQGISSLGFKDLLESSNREAYEIGCRLAQDLDNGGPVSKEETIAYLGLCYQDLVVRMGEKVAASKYAQKGRQAFLPIGVMERAMGRFKPDVVFATNSPRAEQAAILVAAECGIPSVCAVDLFALQEVQWIGKPGYASKVCVLNEAVRHMLLEHGRKEDEVIVTGNPAFDRLQQDEIRAAGVSLRHERGWNDGLVTLLWASQVEPERHPFAPLRGDPTLPRKIEAVLRHFVQETPGFRLVVRYHPSEQVEFVEEHGVTFSPTSESLHALLYAVDGVVVTASTVGLEASFIGKSVVSVDCSIFTADAPYSKMGISHGVPTLDELPAAILRLMKRGQFAKLPSDDVEKKVLNAVVNSSATQKVVNVMESLLKH